MTFFQNTSRRVFIEQVRLLYLNSMIPILVSVVVGAALCWSQRIIVSKTVLITWFTLFFTISVIRICLLFLFKKQQAEYDNMKRWHTRFLIGTYAVAILWGSTSFLLFPDSQPNQMVLFLIIIGMAGGAISSLCPSLTAVSGFLSLMLIPLMLKMMLLGAENSLFLGLLVLLFWVVTINGALKINTSIYENIQLRLQSIEREKIFKTNEERYRHIFSNAPLGIFQYDHKLIIPGS